MLAVAHSGTGPAVDKDPVDAIARHDLFADVVVGRVWVGAREDDHAELAAARDQIAERIAVGQPPTAVMRGDLGGVVGDAAAGAQAGGVAMSAFEVVEPERQVERAWVVL